MPRTIAPSLRFFCMATVLALAVVNAAEPAPTLLGANRDQVIRRLGDPRSQIAAGNRVVMFFAHERVVFRDGVVVEVERIAAESARRSLPSPPPATLVVGQMPATGEPVAAASVPAVPGAVNPTPTSSTAATRALDVANPEAAKPALPAPARVPVADSASSPEPKVEIKLVRPPSPGSPRSPSHPVESMAVRTASPVPLPPATPTVPVPSSGLHSEVSVPAKPAEAVPQAASLVASAPTEMAKRSQSVPPPGARSTVAAAVFEESSVRDNAEQREQELAAVALRKARSVKASHRRLDAAVENPDFEPGSGVFSVQTLVILIVVIGGGVGFLWWQRRQRQLELLASEVSHTPFNEPAGGAEGDGAEFSADFLARIEWLRFEELVEAYYSKTGVVAVRTKGGPSTPAQIKISWKGEPRPFALVRCIPRADDLIDVKPLQELDTLLATEDIRRGYVITAGRFSVAARDYAEEKHLTLLSGDLFLEKLNALPGAARTEIMQAAAAGDCGVPSCPTCEAKMSRTGDSPPVWRCAAHPDVFFPARN